MPRSVIFLAGQVSHLNPTKQVFHSLQMSPKNKQSVKMAELQTWQYSTREVTEHLLKSMGRRFEVAIKANHMLNYI